jgi:hypothetical protein
LVTFSSGLRAVCGRNGSLVALLDNGHIVHATESWLKQQSQLLDSHLEDADLFEPSELQEPLHEVARLPNATSISLLDTGTLLVLTNDCQLYIYHLGETVHTRTSIDPVEAWKLEHNLVYSDDRVCAMLQGLLLPKNTHVGAAL